MLRPGTFLTRRRRYDDLSVSIEEHIAEKIDDLVESGMPCGEAEKAARREFGNVALIMERSREVWEWRWLERLWSDLRFSGRQAARSPMFAVAVVATLGIGIAAQSTVCSVIHAVLIDPYPYRDAMRMVHLHLYDKDPMPNDLGLPGPQFEQFKTSPVFDGAIAEDTTSMAKTDGDLPEEVHVGRLSPDGFQFLGVPPQLGRVFTPSDPLHVAVLNYAFWNSHYAGRADVIGKALELDDVSYTIIGVMPQRFTWTGSEVFIPLEYTADPHRVARVFARLRVGVSDQAADQAFEPWRETFVKETPFNFPAAAHHSPGDQLFVIGGTGRSGDRGLPQRDVEPPFRTMDRWKPQGSGHAGAGGCGFTHCGFFGFAWAGLGGNFHCSS
jgi:hypothetical protein